MKFKAAVLFGKKNIKVDELSPGKLKKGQVLVKIIYTSICNTQIQEIDGSRGKDKFLPHCMGHEATGVVFKVGPKVKKVKENDKVCLSWLNSNGLNGGGTCYLSLKNKKINAGPVNTFSEFAIVSENKIIKLKKNDDLKKHVLMGCAIPTAVNSVLSNLKNFKNDNHLILGAGGIGLLIIFVLKQLKCKKIFALDKNSKKLKVAKKFGASKVILIKDNNEKILKNYQDFFHNIFECTGNSAIFHNSLSLCKAFGGKIILIGNYKNATVLNIDPWFLLFGRKILGSWSAKFNYDIHYKKYFHFFKKFNYNLIFGRKIYKLDTIQKAIDDLKEGKIIRPLIRL